MDSEKKYIRCKRCNRTLKTEQAQLLGYGPKCYRKMQNENANPEINLFKVTFAQEK